jgi:hypothetical protein
MALSQSAVSDLLGVRPGTAVAAWRSGTLHLFTTEWGNPVHPGHPEPADDHAGRHRWRAWGAACTTCATFPRRPCCSRECRCT